MRRTPCPPAFPNRFSGIRSIAPSLGGHAFPLISAQRSHSHKSKILWNDQPENTSQSKVTLSGASLGSGPSPTRQHPAQAGVALTPAFKKISREMHMVRHDSGLPHVEVDAWMSHLLPLPEP